MPYVKQDFGDGNDLYAEQLNHMEQGIYDAMEKAEQGGGGDILLDGIALKDRATEKTYIVYVSNGKLTMEESEA